MTKHVDGSAKATVGSTVGGTMRIGALGQDREPVWLDSDGCVNINGSAIHRSIIERVLP